MKTRAKKSHRRGRGAVLVISVMFISSALLRLGSGAGEALAEAISETTPPETMGHDPAASDDKTVEVPFDRAKAGGLLDALRAREERVKQIETRIEVRSKALAVADQEITRRLAALEQAEANLRNTLALADGAAEDDLARLTAVYENMKPKDAAAIFAAMEPDFAAGFLGRMRSEAAAAVMAGLPPETAYSISVIVAGRNAKAPKS